MKRMKKALAFLLMMVMVMALGMTAAAATTVTIIPNTPDNASSESDTPTYNYYVMMKASIGTNGAIAYYVEDETLANALAGLTVESDKIFTVTKAAGANRWNVTINKKSDKSDFNGLEVAAALQTIKNYAIANATVSNNTITLEYDGYILIESSLGTALVLDTVTTKTISEKNSYPSLKKTENYTNEEIGKDITYTVSVTVPATANKKIIVYDVISDGLTMKADITATAKANDTSTSITGLQWTLQTTDESTGAKTYSVEIPAETVVANAGKTITLVYKATINENAVINVAEENKAYLVYDNFTSVESKVEVKTFGFTLKKVNEKNETLAGVRFTLTNGDGEYYTEFTNTESIDEVRFNVPEAKVATNSDGLVEFTGLSEGVYTLTETETLTGYHLLEEAINVKIDTDGKAYYKKVSESDEEYKQVTDNIKVINKTGTTLPSTGGIGTTIFYVIGAICVLGAGVLLVTRRRMASK